MKQNKSTTQTTTQSNTTFLCIRPNYWGKGTSARDARLHCGGAHLKTKYEIVLCCVDGDVWMDALGNIMWTGDSRPFVVSSRGAAAEHDAQRWMQGAKQ
jgi:hypothetical protein